jgi:hypothetical protein
MPHAEASLGRQAENGAALPSSNNVQAQKRQPKLPFYKDAGNRPAPYSAAAASPVAVDDFLRPTRANLLRNFSTRPPRLSMLFCVPV